VVTETPVRRALTRLQQLSAIGSCSREERLRRATVVLLSLITSLAGVVWGASYAVLGLYQVAAVPIAYAVIVLASIVLFILVERFGLLAYTQLSLLLLLPFVVQWQIGGFVPAGGVMLWAILSPIGALFLFGGRRAVLWFGAYLVLALGSLADDAYFQPPALPATALIGNGGLALTLAILNVVAVSSAVFAIIAYALLNLRREQDSVEQLLLNILPSPIAERIKDGESFIADSFEEVSVLFADVVGFTRLAAAFPADNTVGLLNEIFSGFDDLIERYEVEKIKTIGDAYMIASGLPIARRDHAHVVAEVALGMRATVERIAAARSLPLELRLGIHTGPVVAGIIGLRKFAYDIWGDTVNVASRMESTAPTGEIQVSERAYDRLAPLYVLEPRGSVEVRGRGEMSTWLLQGRRPDVPADAFPMPKDRAEAAGEPTSLPGRRHWRLISGAGRAT
jgi:adenylate cyclase